MSTAGVRHPTSSAHAFLLIPILLLFALLVVAVLRSPSLVSSAGLGSAVIVAAPLVLAAYALTLIVMAGRGGVDLSIGPLIGFINVTLVQLFAEGIVTSVVDFFLYAIGVGIAYQLIMGLIIVYVRIQPIIVALAGYLTLAGLNLVILPRPGGVAPDWMMPWGRGETIWSPILAIVVVATGAWFAFTRTAFFDHLRLMGADERAAYTAGVNITIVRLGAHVIAGVFAGLAALTFTSLIGSGDPNQGSTYTLMAVTAMVLGGTSLAGGRGSIIGSLLGALNIYLITYVLATFSFGMVQSFVTQLSYGVILVVALLLTILLPQIQRYTRAVSPFVVFVVLGLVATGVVLYAQDEHRVAATAHSGSAGLVSLSASSAQSGTSLSGESLSGTSLSGTSLSGTSLSATVEAVAEPTGTPVVVAAVIIAAIVFLIWLFYRSLSLSSLALIAVVSLLVLGYAAHESGVPGEATSGETAQPGSWDAAPPILYLEGREEPGAATTSLLASPWAAGTAFAVGALLLGTVLIFTTVAHAKARVGRTSLLFIAVACAVVTALLFFEGDGLETGPDTLFVDALGAIVIGALLFVVTLPTFQARTRNVSQVMVTLLSVVALGTALFAASPTSVDRIADAPAAAAPAAAAPTDAVVLSPLFLVEVFWVLAGATILFLLMIPGVRRHVMHNITVGPKVRVFSYTGIFIAVTATLAMGAVFFVAGVQIWKFVVALIAGIIGARVLFQFLGDYRRRYGSAARRARLPSDPTRTRRLGTMP